MHSEHYADAVDKLSRIDIRAAADALYRTVLRYLEQLGRAAGDMKGIKPFAVQLLRSAAVYRSLDMSRLMRKFIHRDGGSRR